jgi:hypothetical protein
MGGRDTVTLGICSVPEREKDLEKVLDSLYRQVDHIACVLNGYDHVPNFVYKYGNVWWFSETGENGDKEKFATIDNTHGYYVTWDDDLIAPPDAIQKLIEGVDKYNGLCSFHGRTYLSPVVSFHKWAGNYRCLGNVSEDVKVNFIGSGCACFHTDRLKLSFEDFKLPNMADCYLSRQASLQGVPMMVLKHTKDMLTYTNPKSTIWKTTRDYSEQTKILQSYVK